MAVVIANAERVHNICIGKLESCHLEIGSPLVAPLVLSLSHSAAIITTRERRASASCTWAHDHTA